MSKYLMRAIVVLLFSFIASACSNSFVPAKTLENTTQGTVPEVPETPAEPTPPQETFDMSICGKMSEAACKVMVITNEERAKQGLPAIMVNSKCVSEAQFHAQDMATNNYFSHDGQSETTSERFTRYGLSGISWGENIAAGYLNAKEVMEGWMNSPGHRKNILSAYFKSIGVGYAVDAKGSPYWVQCFSGQEPN